MDTKLKMLIAAGLGGAAGWFIGSVIVEYQKMKENPDVVIYELTNEEQGENMADPDRPRSTRIKVQGTRDYTKYFAPDVKESLEKLAAKYNGEIEVEKDETPDPEESIDLPPENSQGDASEKAISIISLAEFANSQTDYDQVTLTYFMDDVLCDEDESPIPNPEKFVGDEALVSFGMNSQDENVVYVRNHNEHMEYEIVRQHSNYSTPSKRMRRTSPKEDTHDTEEDS